MAETPPPSKPRWLLLGCGVALALGLCAGAIGGVGFFLMQAPDFDQVGGLEVRVDIDLTDVPVPERPAVAARAGQIVVDRFRRIGARGVRVQAVGQSLVVQIPEPEEIEHWTDVIVAAGRLELRSLHEPIWETARLEALLDEALRERPGGPELSREELRALVADHLPATSELLWEEPWDALAERRIRATPYLASQRIELSGEHVKEAGVATDTIGEQYTRVELSQGGAQLFCELSRRLVGKQLLIVFDDRVLSAPVVMEPICGGVVSISAGGQGDPLEARDLAALLQAGTIPALLSIASVRQVGPAQP